MALEFFANADLPSQCTGVDKDLIESMHIILQVLTCGKKPRDISKFEDYAFKIAEICIQKYDWYTMPPSVHKVLIHGAKIIQSFELPIEWYTEEAQIANNKIFRNARANFSRMISRFKTNEDTL